MTVLPVPEADVIVTLLQLPSTTLVVVGATGPELKEPCAAMSVPVSEA